MPTHRLRNGHLNQIAYSLFLFIRDVAEGDLVGWIDDRLNQANETGSRPAGAKPHGLIKPLRNVYGVSDKVLAMALSGILIGAAELRPRWLEVGVHLIAVDTLVHNFLHRTGILSRFEAAHPLWARLLPVRRLRRNHCACCASKSTLGSSIVAFPPFSLGSSNSRSGAIAASKASTSATATGSMTGNGAKTAIAAYTAFATEFA